MAPRLLRVALMTTPLRSALLVSLLALSASAQTTVQLVTPPIGGLVVCPARPTLQQCQTSSYYDTTCGQGQRAAGSVCAQLLRDQSRDSAFDFNGLTQSGAGLPSLDAEKRKLAALASSRAAERQLDQQQRAAFLAGPDVRSCREYVVQKYAAFYAFEDATFPLDAVAATEISQRTAQPGLNRTLVFSPTESKAPSSWAMPSERDNPWRTFVPGSYPTAAPAASRFAWSPTLISQLNAGRRYSPPGSTSWAYVTGAVQQAVARGETEARFAQARRLEEHLLELVSKRESVWKPFITRPDGTQVPTLTTDPVGVAGKLAALDAELQKVLQDGVALGCVTAGIRSVCDWDPELHVQWLRSAIATQRERDQRRCIKATNDEFGATSLVRNARSMVATAPKVDYSGSVADLEQFFVLYDGYMAGLNQAAPVSTTPAGVRVRTLRFASTPTTNHLGDSSFGLDSTLTTSGDLTWPVGNSCQANANLAAGFSATARLFGSTHPAVAANLTVNSAPVGPASYSARVEVPVPFSSSPIVVTAADKFPTLNLVTFNPEKDADITLFEAPFFIGPIPVSLSAGLSGRIGFAFNLSLTTDRTCTSTTAKFVTLNGHAEPYAELDAWGEATAGITGVASAGVVVTLGVFHAHLPIDSSLSLAFDGTRVAQGLLTGSVTLGLDLTTLNGRIDGEFKVLFVPFTIEFFRWPGLTHHFPLYGDTWSLPIIVEKP